MVLIEQVGMMLTNSLRKKVALNTINQPTETITQILTKTTSRYSSNIDKVGVKHQSINQPTEPYSKQLSHSLFYRKKMPDQSTSCLQEKKLH